MKVITLCGSMRFFKEMQEIAMELETKYGYCAITPVGGSDITLNEETVENLAKAHYKKIDISDAVYIVNIGGYIGESVLNELRYAKKHNKEIIYHMFDKSRIPEEGGNQQENFEADGGNISHIEGEEPVKVTYIK